MVTTTIDVAPGSIIDCGSRAIHIAGGHLLVHDAQFILKGASLLLDQQGTIEADCPQGTDRTGFSVQVTGAVALQANGGGKLSARCNVGGGKIALDAGGDVTIAALGIDASGTAQDAPGGSVSIEAEGSVVTSAAVKAGTTGGVASGGTIEIDAASITIGADLLASGSGTTDGRPGGSIVLSADQDLTISGSGFLVDAGTSYGDGGDIALSAGGTIVSGRPLKVRGTGSSSSGGSVQLEAEHIQIDNDIMATGGRDGGGIEVLARSGKVEIGTISGSIFSLDVSGNNSAGGGGELTVRSRGNDVTLAGSARLVATDGGAGGEGGEIDVAGVSVSAATGTQIVADGGPQQGGSVMVQAREALTLNGVVRATDGSLLFVYRDGTPVIGSQVVGPYTLRQEGTLPAPCGDGVRRAGVEECDAPDLDGQTCASRGHAGGALGCTASCTFDETGCSG